MLTHVSERPFLSNCHVNDALVILMAGKSSVQLKKFPLEQHYEVFNPERLWRRILLPLSAHLGEKKCRLLTQQGDEGGANEGGEPGVILLVKQRNEKRRFIQRRRI
ncbi:hypothetical protein ILYODFUR_024834 [Ilyodon furcidens]|uniref:Uncharacterized protein n=1 Tax=Ilyodon furcidens TaxID=33524 RepID=A0ABV0SRA1_9TELE